MKHGCDAIILRRVAYGEADWIVTFLSREGGRLSGIARSGRSSQRRFGGALEPGSVVRMEYSECRGRGLLRLEEATVKVPMNGAMKSLERINAVARALALGLAFLQENEPNPAKFDLLHERLVRLSGADPAPCDSAEFELKWLALCGYAPMLSRCLGCGREADGGGGWSFDFERGGAVCPSCGEGRSSAGMGEAAMRGFAAVFRGEQQADAGDAAAAASLVGRYVDHILGRPLGV